MAPGANAGAAAGRPSLPSTLALELACNPFLRLDSPALRASLRARGEDHADRPELEDLPKDPTISPLVSLWKGVAKPLAHEAPLSQLRDWAFLAHRPALVTR